MLCDPRPQCSVQWPSVDLVHWLWFILASCKHLLQKTLQWQVSSFLPYRSSALRVVDLTALVTSRVNDLGVRLCQLCCRKHRDSGSPGSVSTWSPNCTNSGLLLWWGVAFPKSRANPNHKKRVHPKLGLLHWQEDTALSFLPSRFLPPPSPNLQNTFTEQLKASFF